VSRKCFVRTPPGRRRRFPSPLPGTGEKGEVMLRIAEQAGPGTGGEVERSGGPLRNSPGTSREAWRTARHGPRHSLISSLIHLRTPASIGVHRRPLSSRRDLRGRSCTVVPNPEKRKVGSSILPLTTGLTCADVYLMIVKVTPMTLVVSFLGHPLQADDRTSAHSRRSQACLLQATWDQRWSPRPAAGIR
jgi:hypothetical protein